MDGSIRVGRLLGIEVNVHWSWLFIFFLITWTFAAGVLPFFFEEWGAGLRWGVGALLSLVFFLSILFHEMSHSLMAQRFGIPVHSITLFVFGGFSSLSKESETPREEFWVAIVGPLTSLAFGLLFAVGYFIFAPIDAGVAGVLAHLAVINVAIAIFNMVPGFPLDGGRVLRSAIWAANKNQLAATRLASQSGQVVAFIIMGLGIAAFFFVSIISGIWLFLIGNFLRAAAEATYRQQVVQTLLEGVPAERVAKRDVVPVGPDTSVEALVQDYILRGQGRAYPVISYGDLLGLVTLTDTKKVPREDWSTTPVRQAMTPRNKVKTAQPRDDLAKILSIMGTDDINQVPLIEDGQVVGMVHRGDLIQYIQAREEVGDLGQRRDEDARRDLAWGGR
jgi:Zn-dependent protease/CBS domain-containing protein